MRALLPTIRAALGCLLLTPVAAAAQEAGSEPMQLSRAVRIVAQPLPAVSAEQAGSSASAATGSQSLPSFPFRQVGAADPIAAGKPATSRRRLAPRDWNPAGSQGRTAAPTPTAAVGTVVSSLAIVLGLFAGLIWFAKRFAPAGTGALPKEAVELLGRAPLAGRQTMQLVRIGNRLLLVALSTTGAQTLTEITDPLEVERLAALCQRGRTDSASASFGRVLSQLASEPDGGAPRSRVRGAA